ncbi:hypothetical protein HDU98_011509, partial [Podochytrium sp. JEL0797]
PPCDGSNWVILQDCGSTGERVCKFDVSRGEGVGCFPTTPVASPTSTPVVTPSVPPTSVATSTPAPPVTPEICSTTEMVSYKCTTTNQLWFCTGSNWVLTNDFSALGLLPGHRACGPENTLVECNGSKWVIENDCGAQGLTCNAVGNTYENIGCSPKPPAGLVSCEGVKYGTYQCVGHELQVCGFDPWWTTVEICTGDDLCVAAEAGKFNGCLPKSQQ